MRPGLDLLISDRTDLVRGRRVGLLAHAASVDSKFRHAIHLLETIPGIELARLFGPEHGLWGTAQDMEAVSHQKAFGLDVHSLYGKTSAELKPGVDAVKDLDVLVADLADVGSRYYTFVWTLCMCIETCASAGIQVVVLDRPNPLGGAKVEGPPLMPDYTSFVGYLSVPVRHGMTVGELCRMFVEQNRLDIDLVVVPAAGWNRPDYFDETGLPWIMPSPNMPTLDTALVYPGACLVEGTRLSEARGTTKPFELVGAPGIDPFRLASLFADELDRVGLAGCTARPLYFKPMFQKHAGKTCGGIQVHVSDRSRFRPVETYLVLLSLVKRHWPHIFEWRSKAYEFVTDKPAFDLLYGSPDGRLAIERGEPLEDLFASWRPYLADFEESRKDFLLY